MISFDFSLLSVEIVELKAITTSLGGSISVIDDKRSTSTKEVCKRLQVPMATARAFLMRTKKVTKYLKPVLTALVRYNGHVIAMERHPLGGFGKLKEDGLFGSKTWVPSSKNNIDNILKPALTSTSREWYFDGRYIYAFTCNDIDAAVRGGEFLTSNGQFRKIAAMSIDTQEMADAAKLEPVERSCMAFVTSRGEVAVSPPIWKNLSDVGATQLSKAGAVADDREDGDDEEDHQALDVPAKAAVSLYNFDKIDESLSVSLNFALKAGQEIGKEFGYEFVEPLQLPRLMIELHTVNLPNVPSQIKATYDSGIQFTHAMAWLLGLSRRANNLETYIMMRSLMKYLTSKGVFRKNVFNAERVFKDGKTTTDIVCKPLDELLEQQDFTQLSMASILEQARIGAKARSKSTTIHNIGGMLNEME